MLGFFAPWVVAVVVLVLHLVVPARAVKGYVRGADGEPLRYRLNGLRVLAVALAAAGASLGVCLVIVTLSPAVVVVGFETVGHRHQAASLERALEEPTAP